MPDPNNADNLLTLVSLIGAGISWVYTNQGTFVRSKIKTDFEIRELSRKTFGEDHELTKRIELKLARSIPYLYRLDSERKSGPSWPDFVLGCFCVIATGAFAVLGYKSDAHLHSVLHYVAAAFFGFIASGAFMNAFAANRSPR